AGGDDAPEDRVEGDVVDAEAEVLRRRVARLVEIERQAVVQVDRREWADARRLPRDAEQPGKETRGCDAVAGRDEDVIELDRHLSSLALTARRARRSR